MKLKLVLSSIAILTVVAFSSCSKDVDLVTADAMEGGAISVAANIPYKLGNTPKADVTVAIPRGPAINKIVVTKYFVGKNSQGKVAMSAAVPAFEIAVDGKNAQVANDGQSTFDASYSQTYAQMIAGISFDGKALPTDETKLNIGDKFVYSYKTVMSDDREVEVSSTTNIAIANLYAGTYKSTVLYYHPSVGYSTPASTNIENRDVAAISATVSEVGFAVWPEYWCQFDIDPVTNKVVNFVVDSGWPYNVRLAVPGVDPGITASMVSNYNPTTGVITLYYAYDGSANTYGTTRVFHHKLEPVN